ncbi:hypothetical protein [Ferrimonas pelagia]|uniref:CorA-like Mg2+ transporter protein n=1 Tax=Ferrimonas pelagia TaxID=1177826 RepID=A0ABP9EVK8_9GAMM
MSDYQWTGWGLLPLVLSERQSRPLLSRQPWTHWSEGLDAIQIKDTRRFYTRSTASILRPVKGGRFTLDLAQTDKGCLTLVDEGVTVRLVALQLLIVEGAALIYFHFVSEGTYDAETIARINRTVFAWHPRTHTHSLPDWTDVHGQLNTLRDHLSTLLAIPLDEERDYGEDAFGHELVNCCWVKNTEAVGERSETSDLCVSKLSAGVDLANPRYSLSPKELERLQGQQFCYWRDWRCQFNLNRLVFVDETPGRSSLQLNLCQNHYYLDLFAMVILQRIYLNHFKDELILGAAKERSQLFQRISDFRRRYKVSHMSTYPFAEKLYQYLCDQAGLKEIEEQTFTELDHSHTLWRQEKEETNGSVLLFVSLIAALLLPASSLATIFALNKEQMGLPFWLGSGVITLLTLIFVVLPPLRKYRKEKKQSLG